MGSYKFNMDGTIKKKWGDNSSQTLTFGTGLFSPPILSVNMADWEGSSLLWKSQYICMLHQKESKQNLENSLEKTYSAQGRGIKVQVYPGE